MSWSFAVVGKPSEVGSKVRNALKPSRSQSSHEELFNGIEHAVDAAVKGIDDETTGPYSTKRTLLVESCGHIDPNGASVTFTIKTFHEYSPG